MSATISLTVDVEGEWFELPSEQGSFDIGKLLKALEYLEKLLDRIESRIESKIPVTWFIRCDDSVAALTGKVSGLLESLDNFIARRTAKLDEFGLHPHLYRFIGDAWISETDPNAQKEQIERAAIAWKNFFGSTPRLSRMGESVMNNTIADTLSMLGVEVDSTALANRKRFDSGFQFDWTGTPLTPYIPSKEDYRRPAKGGESAHSFIEIPFTMLPIMGLRDHKPINRYCNLAFKPKVIKDAILKIKSPENIVAVVHPHELLSSNRKHHLIAYKSESLETNIENLSDKLGRLNFTLLSSLNHNAHK
jgi:hypothetical protein